MSELAELFDDVLDLFSEDVRSGSVLNSYAVFKSHVEDNLPPEALTDIKALLGADEDDEDDEDVEGGGFLRVIYDERFKPADPDDDEETFGDFGRRLLCEICERLTKLTRHHLFPKQLHSKLEHKVSATELYKTITICRMCHSTVHRLFSNDELAEDFHSLESLMSTPQMQKYAGWASKQKGGDKRVK